MSFFPASQNKRRALARAGMSSLAVLFVALIAAGRMWDAPVHGVTIAVLIAFCVFAMLEFSVFDELAKRAHYIAWYWGSCVGLAVVAGAHIVVALDAQSIAPAFDWIVARLGGSGPHQAFLAGTMATPLLMMAGFVIVRGADWLRSR